MPNKQPAIEKQGVDWELANQPASERRIVGKGQISLDALVQALTENNLSEVEYEENGCRIYLSRQNLVAPVAPVAPIAPVQACAAPAQVPSEPVQAAPQQPETPNLRDHPGTVKAPMVGVVYVAPEPGAAPFVRVGDTVNPGQTLLIIEAMKVLNPIKASKAGKVLEIFVHNQKPVEYDEPLLVIAD